MLLKEFRRLQDQVDKIDSRNSVHGMDIKELKREVDYLTDKLNAIYEALGYDFERFKADPNDAAKWAYSKAAVELSAVSSAAWHPVSEPPTEEDGGPDGNVLVIYNDIDYGNLLAFMKWQDVATLNPNSILGWARIRDVVLLPPEEL